VTGRFQRQPALPAAAINQRVRLLSVEFRTNPCQPSCLGGLRLFAVNIGVRIVWGFVGNHYARWRQVLPGGSGYLARVRSYAAAFAAGRLQHYLGHNPLGRFAVAVLLVLIAMQALTGLVLAGTDIYFPPFGHWIAQWIAAPGVDPATLVPYSPEMYDETTYADMRAMR